MLRRTKFAAALLGTTTTLLYNLVISSSASSASSSSPPKRPQPGSPALIVPPVAVATWGFGRLAVDKAASILHNGGSALDAVEQGVNLVELDNQDQYFVGYGGFPNADGVMELDAAIMDGNKRSYGAVMGLQDIPRAISVARKVMEKSEHSILVGRGATAFGKTQGFPLEDILEQEAKKAWLEWKASKKQPPDPDQHDTIGLICRDQQGNIVAGTSTSGWRFKLPGRVGDSPLIGSGLYADGDVGAAVATGDGEEILRVCLSFLVVEKMRDGLSPTEACRVGIERLKRVVNGDGGENEGSGDGGSKPARMHDQLTVAVIAMNKDGEVGAASTLGPHNEHRGRPAFPFVVWRCSADGPNASTVELEAADHEPGQTCPK